MLKHNSKSILKTKLLKIIILKNIVSNLIKKSIFQNRNIKAKIRLFAFFNLNKNKITKTKIKNTCLLTGRKKSINKQLHFSRHQLNIISKNNNLHNFKINS